MDVDLDDGSWAQEATSGVPALYPPCHGFCFPRKYHTPQNSNIYIDTNNCHCFFSGVTFSKASHRLLASTTTARPYFFGGIRISHENSNEKVELQNVLKLDYTTTQPRTVSDDHPNVRKYASRYQVLIEKNRSKKLYHTPQLLLSSMLSLPLPSSTI